MIAPIVSIDTTHLSTIRDFLRYAMTQAVARDLYFGHGTDNVRDDIWSLITGALGLPFSSHDLLPARVSADEHAMLTRLITRRVVERVPVPYLIHEAMFCGLAFYVDERVLIPRSPVAELIETQFSPWITYPEGVTQILDLCTGSACIAIACCDHFADAAVDAVDISSDALAVATINQERYDLTDRLTLIQSDLWENVPRKKYDIIISNPPYVSNAEMATLPQEYLHEPDMALRASNEGIAIVDRILQQAHDYLAEDGILVVEVGNAEEALINAYPTIPFIWLSFERGGQGVFLLTREQLQDIAHAR